VALLLLAVGAGCVAWFVPAANGQDVVLYDFYSEWCGPCKAMATVVDELAATGVSVKRIDIDRDPETADRFGVNSIPCFITVERGREVDRIVGKTTIERLKVKLRTKEKQSTPAWRYENPTGHRAAVVRIYCQDSVRTRSIGSGVLVRWGEKILVLTARHVVQDAKKIIVELATKKTHWATVLKADAAWDCAVLELSGLPVGVQPAEIEYGQNAMQGVGDRLESCGYGSDNTLASNSGLFIGYRRSDRTPDNGPDDWMVISGHARSGDSGGPVFNQRGRVVGILWGTDGKEVVCVQAGRVHQTIAAAVRVRVEQKSFRQLAEQTGILQRNPTPPMPGPIPYAPLVPVQRPQCGPNGCEPGTSCEQADITKNPMLPWRGEAESRDKELDARTNALLQALEQERQARLQGQQQPNVSIQVAPKPDPVDAISPMLAGLCVLGALAAGIVLFYIVGKN
jgi:thioredoxin 1